jgi:multiple sugar transport system permease protein
MIRALPRLSLYSGVILVCAVTAFPIYWMIVTALSDAASIRSYPPSFWPSPITFDAFRLAFTERPMLGWLQNSVAVSLAATAASLLVSIFAAYSLSRYRSRVGTTVGLTVLVSKMIPTTLLVIPLFVLFKNMGMIASLSSVVIAHCTLTIPFAIWMLKAYFDSIPIELEEAAQVDGCTPLGTLWRIVLPVSLPGLGATALYAFILSWNEFAFARTLLISNPPNWTVTVGIASIKGEYIISWNEVMAASAIAAVPIIVVFMFLERYFVAGLTAGAQK